ncbi:hypothetical protein [Aliivibrio fischeri]|uniref:hypothetical protein n=1 Tax=Aliivibrio fischeri TaxID=668 RepID=UPI0007C56FC6|nr:hypothetical protein [Aliivibrio fischeri]
MIFFRTLDTNSTNMVDSLSFNEDKHHWIDIDKKYYPLSFTNNIVPVHPDDECKCLNGFFVIKVTDPQGAIAYFNLFSNNEIISCGMGELYPGVSCDEDVEGKKLEDSGIKRTESEYSYIPHMIAYAFNEGAQYKGTLELSPFNEVANESEEIFFWEVL